MPAYLPTYLPTYPPTYLPTYRFAQGDDGVLAPRTLSEDGFVSLESFVGRLEAATFTGKADEVRVDHEGYQGYRGTWVPG